MTTPRRRDGEAASGRPRPGRRRRRSRPMPKWLRQAEDLDQIGKARCLLVLDVLLLLQLLQLLRKDLQQLNDLLQGLRDVRTLCRERPLRAEERRAVRVELLRGIAERRSNAECGSNHVNSFVTGIARRMIATSPRAAVATCVPEGLRENRRKLGGAA